MAKFAKNSQAEFPTIFTLERQIGNKQIPTKTHTHKQVAISEQILGFQKPTNKTPIETGKIISRRDLVLHYISIQKTEQKDKYLNKARQFEFGCCKNFFFHTKNLLVEKEEGKKF